VIFGPSQKATRLLGLQQKNRVGGACAQENIEFFYANPTINQIFSSPRIVPDKVMLEGSSLIMTLLASE
jgi:hypothetical protein